MSQGPLCPNLSQKVQKEVFQMANRNLSCVILLGGLSVNLNHLKTTSINNQRTQPLSGSCLTTEWETKPYNTHSEQFSTHVKAIMNTASNTSQFI